MAGKSEYIHDLKHELRELEKDMARARRRLDAGEIRDRPDAAGDLAVLEARHAEIEARIDAAREDGAEEWSSLHEGFREQLDDIGRTIASLFGPRDRGDN